MTTRYSAYAAILATSVLLLCPVIFFIFRDRNNLASLEEKVNDPSKDENSTEDDQIKSKNCRKCLILYATTTGTSKTMANRLFISLQRKFKYEKNIIFQLKNIQDFDEEKLHEEDIIFFVVSTWNDGQPVQAAVKFMDWLRDVAYDFRWDKNHLERLHYAMFGIGSAVYREHFCSWVSLLLDTK